jgi:hypothetical protein
VECEGGGKCFSEAEALFLTAFLAFFVGIWETVAAFALKSENSMTGKSAAPLAFSSATISDQFPDVEKKAPLDFSFMAPSLSSAPEL